MIDMRVNNDSFVIFECLIFFALYSAWHFLCCKDYDDIEYNRLVMWVFAVIGVVVEG